MARMLDVYLHRDLVGHRAQRDGGQVTFQYEEILLYSPREMPRGDSGVRN